MKEYTRRIAKWGVEGEIDNLPKDMKRHGLDLRDAERMGRQCEGHIQACLAAWHPHILKGFLEAQPGRMERKKERKKRRGEVNSMCTR